MVIKMDNNILNLEEHEKFKGSKFSIPSTGTTEKKDDNMDDGILFKELKDDMREREQRSEKRFKEQQELLLNRIDKKMDDRLGSIEKEIKDIKNSNFRWGIGIIVTILVAFIGVLPQLIEVIFTILQN